MHLSFSNQCLLLLCLLISACQSDSSLPGNVETEPMIEPTKKLATTTKNEQQLILVLCDYSMSLDSNSIQQMARNAYQIVKHTPINSRLVFLPMEDGVYPRPLLDYQKNKKPGNAMAQKKWAAESHQHAKRIAELLQQKYHAQELKRSCILTGLKAGYNFLKGFPQMDKKIIILSDMLECCGGSYCGENLRNYPKMIQRISAEDFSDYPLGSILTADAIAVLMNSSNNRKYNKITQSKDFNKYWAKVSEAFGLQHSIHHSFSTQLPSYLVQ